MTKYFQWVFDSLFLSREMCPFLEPQIYIPAFDVVTLANTTFGMWFAAHICSLGFVPRDGRLLSLGWGSYSIPNERVEVFSGLMARWMVMLSCGLEQL